MPAIELTEPLARAVAQDCANRQMQREGREQWNEDDWNLACEKLVELMGWATGESDRERSRE